MFIDKANRKIIPRWRDFLTTTALGELASEQRRQNAEWLDGGKSLDKICAAWTAYRTLWHALDLVSAALVVEAPDRPEAQDAAKFIIENASHCPDAGVALAGRVLKPESDRLSISADDDEVTLAQLRRDIHKRRGMLKADPRNSVAWVDLARLYTIAGQREKALHAIEVAYAQQPDNRFVLRSASRFFVHIGEQERALRVLRTSTAVDLDPWLAAAEIGVSLFVGKAPKLVKSAKRLLADDDVSAFMASELASALGTLELEGGSSKVAKRLFQRSLTAPTENSLAQAEWATKQIASLQADISVTDAPRSYEAKALHGFTHGYWSLVLENSLRWLRDQPFSSRPAGVASYVYSTMFDEHADAEKVLRFSLKANPEDRLLTNNLAYALVCQRKIDEAEYILAGIDPRSTNDLPTVSLRATMGCLFFRKGQSQEGIRWYREAMELARHLHQVRYEVLAALHLARETILARLPDSDEIFREARQKAEKVGDADVAFVLAKVEELQHQTAPKAGQNSFHE